MDTTIEWLSTATAAEMLGVQSRTLYRFIDEGRLPAYRFGRVIRVMRTDLEQFVVSCRIEPGSLSEGVPHAASEPAESDLHDARRAPDVQDERDRAVAMITESMASVRT
jgi:excisionase family DNA binding protein